MGKYILNQETQKIELHFDKSEYMSLSEGQKKEIKSSFLWSRYAGAWVSRSTRNHYWALQVAQKLGLEDGGKEGERLSYAEELERKTERAEARAERMEEHAANAEKRAKNLQSSFNECRKDWSWLTQPNVNSSGGRAFTNQRNRIIARYEKGFDEYRKSEYFQDRAETARNTADKKQLKNPVYLHNRIKEQNATIKKLESNIVSYEDKIYRIQQGETFTSYTRGQLTAEQYENWIEETLEKLEYEIDKLAFFQNCLDKIGGNKFSRENIKVGYIVKIARWGRCEVVSAGPVNVTFKILDGGAAGGVLTDPYAAIVEILEAKETKKETLKPENPYKVGDILTAENHAGSIWKAYQVVKVTATGVKIQQIAVENRKPIPGSFKGEPMQKKIVKSKWSDWVGVYDDDRQLHKYKEKELTGAV